MKKFRYFLLSLMIVALGACGGDKPVEESIPSKEVVVEEESVQLSEEVDEKIKTIKNDTTEEVEAIKMDANEAVEKIDQVEEDMKKDMLKSDKEN